MIETLPIKIAPTLMLERKAGCCKTQCAGSALSTSTGHRMMRFFQYVKAKIEKLGLDPTSSTPKELHNFLVSETERIRKIAVEAKMLEHKK